MKFGEMLDWALRLRALGALRAWVGARGPTSGIGADGSHGSRILEVDRQKTPRVKEGLLKLFLLIVPSACGWHIVRKECLEQLSVVLSTIFESVMNFCFDSYVRFFF